MPYVWVKSKSVRELSQIPYGPTYSSGSIHALPLPHAGAIELELATAGFLF